MFADARRLAPGTILECDLCIVGAGPVGIAIARRFADTSLQVCVLEAGGRDQQAGSQALLAGGASGQPYLPLSWTRLARFGGTTGWWGGECRPFDAAEDLAPRPWLGHPGWPVTAAELAPFEAEAAAFCGFPGQAFEPAADLLAAAACQSLPLDPSCFVTRLFRYGTPTDLGARHGPGLEQADNIQVLLHAPVTTLEADEAGAHVRTVCLAPLPGVEHRIRARQVVLAAGGIENARLLLASGNSPGLGNAQDQVGRCFMEHLYLDDVAHFTPTGDCPPLRPYTRRSAGPDGMFKAALAPTAALLAEAGSAHCCFKLASPLKRAPAMLGALHLGHGLRTGYFPASPVSRFRQIARGAPGLLAELARCARQGELGRPGRPRAMPVSMVVEQLPNPASRVTLSAEKDRLARPLPHLDWQLGEADRTGWVRTLALLGQGLARRSLGRLERRCDESPEQAIARLRPACHHMGTTRMSVDPAQGVVDRDGRVHGIDNLYIAGSSVFPTAGHANPMLTAIMLALRLADHLATGGR